MSRTAGAGFVRNALKQAIRYTEHLTEVGIDPSVGSVGDSDDNARAKTVIGQFKTGIIRPRGSWRSLEAVEFDTLEWVDRLNTRRLLVPVGHVPPTEANAAY